MRFVHDGFPVAAPFQSQIHPERADGFILGRFIEVFASFKYADVERDAEVVIRNITTDAPWSRSGPVLSGLARRVRFVPRTYAVAAFVTGARA